MQTMPPKLIITRPQETGALFAQKVREVCSHPVDVILSPGIQIVPLDVATPIHAEHFVFTSANGVAQADRLGLSKKARAWCVGRRTGDAAKALGFEVTVGGGDAAQLVQTLQDAAPDGRIVHIAGKHVVGDVAAQLCGSGLNCIEVAAYDQAICRPTDELQTAMSGVLPLVIPLFSARSGLMLTTMPWRSQTHIIAISQNVAEAAADWGADVIKIARKPDEKAMIDATCVVLDQLNEGPSVA